ncbi:MAG: ribosome biogenesis GTPase Der [Victivallaceae bacterium]|nr:ribosome biogenesis GTPase Der [Victivallaceae bacterium]
MMNPETNAPVAALPVIAIVGRPNVGKSSLFNAILGRRLSIVHEQPGVTRDRVTSTASFRGKRFLLVDTGGLGLLRGEKKEAADSFDHAITEQAESAIGEADVLLFVVNAQEGIVPLDLEVAKRLRTTGKNIFLAVNKCDNPQLEENSIEFTQLGFDQDFPISCLHKRGLNALLENATRELPKSAGESDDKPFRIAIVGRPNVGKSSLVNAFLGEDRVIVSDIAGTTRDAVDIDFTLDNHGEPMKVVLVDTAGLRRRGKVDTVVEYFSAMRSTTAIAQANLVIMLIECADSGVTAQDKKVAAIVEDSGKPCILAANKSDTIPPGIKQRQLEQEIRRTLPGLSYAPLRFISAKKHLGIGELLDEIGEVVNHIGTKLPTSVVTAFFREMVDEYTPPVVGAAPLKFYYGSMTRVDPPTFLLFVNEPKYCAENYIVFLKNQLRSRYGFDGMPIRFDLRARPKKVESVHTVKSKPMTVRGKKFKK